ncbi:MAG TPA: recombinase family protein [Tepidisphaeraceae bacterium]|nr:recombinase family protein [Tepidisphaeraceae bacterium]
MSDDLKRYWTCARVSGREQEREGFSLGVQDDGFKAYVTRNNGVITRSWSIAETASKSEEREIFKQIISEAKKHASEIDAILFYKVDRSARNLKDYLKLEDLEADFNVPFIAITQPTDNTPAGRMMRRQLAVLAAYQTEQQSIDVKEGHAKRIKDGWFVSTAPYGYRNIRVNGRGVIEINPDESWKVEIVYRWYAYENMTIEAIADRLAAENICYCPSLPRWSPSKIHTILRDRAYIGEVRYKNQWYPGKQKPLIDRITWDRVQVLLGKNVYKAHELAYAGELIHCAHCGAAITGEAVIKKSTGKVYIYYRCVRYKAAGHPPVRLTEAKLDAQMIALFQRMKLADDLAGWLNRMLLAWTKARQEEERFRTADLQRQLTHLRTQQDRLLNMRLIGEIDGETFTAKSTEMRDRIASLKLLVDAADRRLDEKSDLAIKAFELSQRLEQKWLTAGGAAKRRILDILCLNLKLRDVSIEFTMRKPFDLLAEGLFLKNNRGYRIRTCDL